ncbi:hypothetical protein [Aquipuribacter sp. MA13-6]|uniref:hypothetical protein n=1 Tax=unclassified Aquipuribacter TaxID=2635084 RepID=UPI003EEEF1A8
MADQLPSRADVLQAAPLLCTFDVDCGEVLPGHRFIARGLSGPSELPLPWGDEDDEDGEDGEDGEDEYRSPEQIALDMAGRSGYPAFALEYELVPGIPPSAEEGSFFDHLVGITYDADVLLPWDGDDGGAIAPFEGGPSTHRSRGEWPLPPDARVLTFTLFPPMSLADDGSDEGPKPLGRLVVDLETSSGRWVPEQASAEH